MLKAMRCPNCGRELVVIEMNVGGERLVLHSCSPCDLRWWEGHDGGVVPLAGVLGLATAGR
jgi:transcription elongation factor Elf1